MRWASGALGYGPFRWERVRPGVRRAAARAGPGRGVRGRPGALGAEGLDWFAGIAAGAARLRAATQGQAALEPSSSSEFDPEEFTPADHAALAGEWVGASSGVCFSSMQVGYP
jgi:hypothetical protein